MTRRIPTRPTRDWLPAAEVARLTDSSLGAVRQWITRRCVTSARTVHGRRLVYLPSVREYLAGRTEMREAV